MLLELDKVAISASIFRAYDIRGIVNETLTPETVFLIGQALGSLAQEMGEKRLVMGRDGRLSGPLLSQALSKGIMASGCDVIDIGVVPTPVLYYATYNLETNSGVILTGSHNPPEYNGLKMMVAGKALTEEAIQALCHRIQNQQFSHGHGVCRELNIASQYINHIADDIKLARPLRMVIDAGHGVAGLIASELYQKLGCQVDELYCDIDGNFPHHHPDPSQPANLQDLIQRVRETHADIGLAFDGDGDRLGVVTSAGEIIWPDRQLMLFAKDVLSRNPAAKIIFDVKCTSHLSPFIRALGGEPIMWKTGHSFIKAKVAEMQALLAGEMSGHIFFKERWYGFDDAIYAGARLLEILSHTEESSEAVFQQIPNSVNTPEMKIAVAEEEKFSLMQRLVNAAQFSEADDVTTIDGVRVNFVNGWGLIRPSNTTPYLVLRFEAESELSLRNIQLIFRNWLLAVEPSLAIPF